MFVDEAKIHVKAGDGGNGCVSFRREKSTPKGGPDGGDGGRGGSVIFIADPNKDTLLDFAGKHHWKARSGQSGEGKKKAGEDGEDLVVYVPVGTMVFDLDTDTLLADLTTPEVEVVIAKGGRGGKGNWHFKSATNQTPRFAVPGRDGEERNLKLELKLIADVGLVGMPNAGKSTLLASVSAARPKVAAYPFTTLDPQLGIVEVGNDRRIVMADIPGLIEGAKDGAGLGHAFLRHIERTKIIVHMLDLFPADESDPAGNYKTIRKELEAFSPELAEKREIIVASKLDLAMDDKALKALRKKLKGKEVLAVSGASRQGLTELLEKIWSVLAEVKHQAGVDAAVPAPARVPPHKLDAGKQAGINEDTPWPGLSND
jgi:GTP-binding protein